MDVTNTKISIPESNGHTEVTFLAVVAKSYSQNILSKTSAITFGVNMI